MHRHTTKESNPDTPEILDQTHVGLRRMAMDDQITQDVYCKNLVALAARWLVLGRREDASAMVCELPSEYVAKVLPVQMATDDNFRKVALHVSVTLGREPMDLDEDDVRLTRLMLERPKARA